MRAGFPAWQQFNQRTNFINPSAIRGGGTSGTRYARNRGREGERRAWRRIGEPVGGRRRERGDGGGGGGGRGGGRGGLAATISLMLVRPVAATDSLSRARARARRTISGNGNGKLFKRHVYRHVPSRTYGHARVCARPCSTLLVPPQYRADTRISRYTLAFHGREPSGNDARARARARYHRPRAHYHRRLRRIRDFRR